MADAFLKLLSGLYGLVRAREFRASRAVEGNAAHMGRAEGLWWTYKFYWRAVEEPEPGSGLEEFFDRQDLDFSKDEGFEETASMTLCAGGDILVSPDLRPETTTALWDDVRSFCFDADLACANLETPVSPSSPPGFLPKSILGPMALNGTPAMLDRIVDGGKGVTFFSTANNHCLDQGEAGLRETLDLLDRRGCGHVGTARSPEERDAVVMVERCGVKLAFVSFTYGLNWKELPEGQDYLANYVRLNLPDVDISPIARQVAAARAAGADAVVACLHWSLEFESFPTRHLVDMGHRLVEFGIDLIIGNHPHNAQPIERHVYVDAITGERREGLILYALGDLLTIRDGILPNSHLGLLARVRIAKGRVGGKERARIAGLEILPTYLFPRMKRGSCEDFRLLDFRKLAAELRAGINRHALSRAQARDVPRLEALMLKLFSAALPRKGTARVTALDS
ncbi:MAG: CapA family protein [Spirochaetaceae bacterium]|nr:CapA family protein [Spirochaetaceae bacterium]